MTLEVTCHTLLLTRSNKAKFSPVLEKIAVDSVAHQMKLLACLQEPCCNKKRTCSENIKSTLSQVRHALCRSNCAKLTSLVSPATISPPANRGTPCFRYFYLSPKDSGRAECYRKLYKAHTTKIKTSKSICHLYACFIRPTFTLMQHLYRLSWKSRTTLVVSGLMLL